MTVETAAQTEVLSTTAARLILKLGAGHTEQIQAQILPTLMQGIDLILGNDWLTRHKAVIDYENRTCRFRGDTGKMVVLKADPPTPATCFSVASIQQAAKTEFISGKQAERMMRKSGHALLVLVQAQEHDLAPQHKSAPTSACLAAAEVHVPAGLKARLQDLLGQYKDVFEPLNELPPERNVGHAIPLEGEARPPFRRPYRLSKLEMEEVQKQVKELLSKGFIQPSCSPYGAPVLFAPKPDGTLRMCIDYRMLNKLTVRDRFPLPRVDDLFDKLHGKTCFSKLDLQAGYYQIRIRPEDVPKTAFVTTEGQYEFKVLPMGLSNAPATFQREMNSMFRDMINKSLLIYLDDILVMSDTADQHLQHLEAVLLRLREHKYRAKLSKCEFFRAQLKFLGHIVSSEGIAPDPDKIQAVVNWPRPTNVKELMAFLGTANYLRKHVLGYGILAGPLTVLTSKAHKSSFDWSNWTPETIAAFEAVKSAIAQAVRLAHPDLNGEFEVRADASIDGYGAILLQNGRPIAFLSRLFTPAERNYTTTEQEMLALVSACKEWRCYLESSAPFTLVTDHQALTYLQNQEVISRRLARWLEFLGRFKYNIVYQPGAGNPADPLSRKPVLAVTYARLATTQQAHACRHATLAALTRAQARKDHGQAQTKKMTAKPKAVRAPEPIVPAAPLPAAPVPAVQMPIAQPPPPPGHPSSLVAELITAYAHDPAFARAEFTSKLVWSSADGLYRLSEGGAVVVPEGPIRQTILSLVHDAAWAGHVGVTKTLCNLKALFWWQSMKTDVRHYVANCDACQRNKHSNQKPAGLLQSLTIPGWRWESVSMDFIVKLPRTANGYDAILVFVDRLSKMVHLVPCKETATARDFAIMFRDNVWKAHGLPSQVVSDRGSLFIAHFWEALCKLIGIEQGKTTAFHPQSDGQTERYNGVLEVMLRHYVSPTCDDWDDHLACAEFAINNSWNETIRSTPFFVNYGQSPLTPVLAELRSKDAPTAKEFAVAWQTSVERARKFMRIAQERQQRYANQQRRDVDIKAGDLVMLSTRNLKIKAGVSSRKLLPRFIGPFTVREMVGSSPKKVAARLDLPHNMRHVHPVFHVSLLKPYLQSREQALKRVAPPPIDWLDDEPLYRVEVLLDHRDRRFGKGKPRREYLIKWEGYGHEHNTWEPRSHLLTCDDLLRTYHAAHNLSPVHASLESDSESDLSDADL
jgi:hypothetical protein